MSKTRSFAQRRPPHGSPWLEGEAAAFAAAFLPAANRAAFGEMLVDWPAFSKWLLKPRGGK